MTTGSDPHEWYRQEELACERARRRMRRGGRASLVPIYAVTAVIAAGVIYILLILFDVPLPSWPR